MFYVHPPGLEPGITVPKTVVISISPQVVIAVKADISIDIYHNYASINYTSILKNNLYKDILMIILL